MTREHEERQAAYYRETASAYDAMHVDAEDEHGRALRFISQQIVGRKLESILDVGCGTGRALRYMAAQHPNVDARGVEPVEELIERAVAHNGISPAAILQGRGEALPYPDASFDAVCEFGVLHHVRRPARVVSEMLRVARKAVFISDSNRFGQGRPATRWLKLALYKCGVWTPTNLLYTRGRGYHWSEGDGLSYSYSVYDDYRRVAAWATQIMLIPSDRQQSATWLTPLLTSGHVLLCAFR